MEPYDEEFFEKLDPAVLPSAESVVPLVLEMVKPGSVVDVGCGWGAWLSVFQSHGIEDFLGVDGAHLDASRLRIPREKFLAADLSKPLALGRTFDLAVSVEVAEHLSAEHAGSFVRSLTALAPVVLFSAAIPFQGGTNHINEQWPGYWVELFEGEGYAAIDCLRTRLWENEKVMGYYAQNLMFFAKREDLHRHPRLKAELDAHPGPPASLVHPKVYLNKVKMLVPKNFSVRALLFALPLSAKRAVQWRVKRLLGMRP